MHSSLHTWCSIAYCFHPGYWAFRCPPCTGSPYIGCFPCGHLASSCIAPATCCCPLLPPVACHLLLPPALSFLPSSHVHILTFAHHILLNRTSSRRRLAVTQAGGAHESCTCDWQSRMLEVRKCVHVHSPSSSMDTAHGAPWAWNDSPVRLKSLCQWNILAALDTTAMNPSWHWTRLPRVCVNGTSLQL